MSSWDFHDLGMLRVDGRVDFQGYKITQDPNCVVFSHMESLARSPSRARRREKQGHRQKYRAVMKPDTKIIIYENTMIMHPETYRDLMAEIKKRAGEKSP